MKAAAALRHALRRGFTPAARMARRSVLPRVVPKVDHRWPDRLERLRIVGLLRSSSGLGRSARLCMDVLGRAGFDVAGVDVSGLYRSDDGLPFVETRLGRSGPPQLSIYHLNPPMLLPGIIKANPLRFLGTYNVSYWAWELGTLPGEWIDAIRFVDAVMVPSTFCRNAIARHTDKPVLVVPHPVPLSKKTGARPSGDRFRVVSILNFGSSFERKNPLASVQAFKAAFGTDPSAELLLKVSDGTRYPADRVRLLAAIADADNIRLIDEVWDESRLDAFIASANAYLSLHRSEGFGLTLAEAIAAGVPIVATNWSGNTDFCRPDLCFAVDYDLVPVHDPHLCFDDTEGAVWAEPIVAHAAKQLQLLRANEEAAREAALKLREHLRGVLAAKTYGDALAALERQNGAAAPEFAP